MIEKNASRQMIGAVCVALFVSCVRVWARLPCDETNP